MKYLADIIKERYKVNSITEIPEQEQKKLLQILRKITQKQEKIEK